MNTNEKSNASQPNRDRSDLLDAVNNVDTFLNYASLANVDISDKEIRNIIKSSSSIRAGKVTTEIESVFWHEYLSLSKKFHPASIESIKLCSSSGKQRYSQKPFFQIFKHSIYLFFTLIILTALQVYVIIGSNQVNELKILIENRNQIWEKIDNLTDSIAISDAPLMGSTIEKINNEERKLEDVSIGLITRKGLLQEWYYPICDWLLFWSECSITRSSTNLELKYKKQSWEMEKQILTAEIALEPISKYILPLLYGLLGAIVYSLRSIAREVKNFTFSSYSIVQYQARLSLGALAGLAIGWFVSTGSSPSVFESITPVALAFLAGYSVEILFNTMDRIISAFSTERAKKQA